MTVTSARALSLVVFSTFLGMSAIASGPTFWTVATAADLLAGKSEGVFVSLDGVVTAGPRLTNRLTSAPAQIWSVAQGADGTLWAGTGGGEGRVLRLRAGQAEDVVFEATESNIFAVAVEGSTVYAASSPDGKVTALAADGSSRTFFDPAEKYIWALATDAEGRLWVGAGTPAVVYRVAADGTSEVVHHPPADHVVRFARDTAGRMLAGTESPGRLYRYDSGRPFVLLDSGLTELRAIAIGANGAVFAAGVARGDSSPSEGETTSVAVTTPAVPAPAAASSSSAATAPTNRRSVVFRIEPDGQWETIWQTADVVYDLIAQGDEGVLAATGPAGRLYRIGTNREVLLYTGVDARQITAFAGLAPGSGRLSAFATSNPGRIVAIGDGLQSPATYISDVRDTNSIASWGLVRWEGAGNVALYTRSGNTEEPDDSWSAWAGPYTAAGGVNVTSPPARFLQWKAELTQPGGGGAAPSLTAVIVAYLPKNARPAVTGVTVHPPGVVFQRPFSSDDGAIAGLDDAIADARRPPGDSGPPAPPPGRRMYMKGLQTLAWTAADADTDRLSYSLRYRRDGEAGWQTLRADLHDPIFVWDTTSMADGRYVVRVEASDAPTNAGDRALTGSRDSETIVIDNTPPSVEVQVSADATGARIAVRVQDAGSPILKVEYSVRGGPWQLVYPADGLADSLDERYDIRVASRDEAAQIVVRAIDRLQNVTSRAVGR
jgi:hypothetical protein